MNSSLDNVYELLRLGYGDAYRLENLKKRLESGKVLYISDNDYLQKLVYQHRGEIQVAEHKKPEPTPEYKAMREAYRSTPEPIPEPTLPTPEPTLPTPEPTPEYKAMSGGTDALPEPIPQPDFNKQPLPSKKDPNERRNAALSALIVLIGVLVFMFIFPWGEDGVTVYQMHTICTIFPNGPDGCDTIGWYMIGGIISVILGILALIGTAVSKNE